MKDGGPAFPTAYFGNDITSIGGMLMRQWYAGMAMSKLIHSQDGKIVLEDRQTLINDIAETSFLIADAMIAESERER